ncbi:MAG: hypothetical protein Q9191_001067 [Dirinaria sp. TL-2023a]
MATTQLTAHQLRALEITERVASCFSLIGTTLILVTFASSSKFRKPINRLIFYASWGNTLCNVATMISESGIRAGQGSHLCQFQAFLIQMFVPADALWNLAMAVNVYMTLFKKYNAEQLKALEWRYHAMCYGGPFIIALVLIFVETSSRGKIYGPAVLWCWISTPWDFLRLAVCYAPAWVSIIAAFTIYVMAGRELFKKRKELRFFHEGGRNEKEVMNYKTTHVQITSELAGLRLPIGDIPSPHHQTKEGRSSNTSSSSSEGYEQYTVSIGTSPTISRPHPMSMVSVQRSKSNAAVEANKAAWGYTKVALLFFVSLLVTWVPSSINRVYSLAYPNTITISNEYAAGVVLSLMGFWNSVIYFTTSRAACKDLILRAMGMSQPEELVARRFSTDDTVHSRTQSRTHSRTHSSAERPGDADVLNSTEELGGRSIATAV